jgi:hypothetical protein
MVVLPIRATDVWPAKLVRVEQLGVERFDEDVLPRTTLRDVDCLRADCGDSVIRLASATHVKRGTPGVHAPLPRLPLEATLGPTTFLRSACPSRHWKDLKQAR